MTSRTGGVLYSPALLSLAVELANYPFDPDAALTAEARSRSCGSVIEMSADAGFTRLGLKVSACAVGQAAAAIFARHAAGRTVDEIADAQRSLVAWLEGEGARPDWPDIGMLDDARAYPGRHAAIQLPWRAALAMLSNPTTAR